MNKIEKYLLQEFLKIGFQFEGPVRKWDYFRVTKKNLEIRFKIYSGEQVEIWGSFFLIQIVFSQKKIIKKNIFKTGKIQFQEIILLKKINEIIEKFFIG